MDDLKALMGSLDSNRDLIDRLVAFLDRQTDHKLSPQMLMGFLGMFNMLSIMSLVHDSANSGSGIKEVTALPENTGASAQSLAEAFSGMLKPQDAGQPDLMGMLGNLASKKKINPSLLLSLLSMINNQGGGTARPKEQNQEGQDEKPAVPPVSTEKPAVPPVSAEKHRSEQKDNAEKYDRKKGFGERI